MNKIEKKDRDEFVKSISELVEEYISDWDRFDSNPQIMVNPALYLVELVDGKDMLQNIADSEEAIEDAAYAQGDETESASDFQASQDPDYYPVKKLMKASGPGVSVPDMDAINAVADRYFK